MKTEAEIALAKRAKPNLFRDFSLSAVTAAFVAVLVSYSGPFAVITQAAQAGGLSAAETTSWVWAVSIGSGFTCLVLSLWTRMPIITAWSTPGAALLITSLGGYSFPEAIGAYLFAAVAMTIIGYTGALSWVMDRIPKGIVAALLAGILLQFVLALRVRLGRYHGERASPLDRVGREPGNQ